MSGQIFQAKSLIKLSLPFALLFAAAVSGCAVSAAKSEENPAAAGVKNPKQEKSAVVAGETKNSVAGGRARIKISAGSPAEAIRVFYQNLREKRFREAMIMTNLRAAVEGLTDAEMEDLRPDFEPLAAQVPAEIQINGEIISNNQATVTARMPDEESGALELKEFKLRRENNQWVILTADEEAEKLAKKEGKNYFFMLRVEIHHVEARNMMERIAKAQMVYAAQNNGQYGELQALVSQGLLPPDAQNSQSTGYRYHISLSADRKRYVASAEPAAYGKTGKLSYILEILEKEQKAQLRFEDNKGAPLKAKKS